MTKETRNITPQEAPPMNQPQPEEQQAQPPEAKTELEIMDEFYALYESLETTMQNHHVVLRLKKKADDDVITFASALEQLKKIIEKRKEIQEQIEITWKHPEYNLRQETINQLGREIRAAVSIPAGLLGNGKDGLVYSFRSENRNLCIKQMSTDARQNNERLFKNRTIDSVIANRTSALIKKELKFMNTLRNLEVDGVRTPKPLFAFKSDVMRGIVMEELHAMTMQRIVEGQTTLGIRDELPENFDIDDFFSRLRSYIIAMHKKGIIHGDIALRNIMIDRETGAPYLIDFGDSNFTRDKDLGSRKALENDDLKKLRDEKQRLKEWMDRRASK